MFPEAPFYPYLVYTSLQSLSFVHLSTLCYGPILFHFFFWGILFFFSPLDLRPHAFA